MRYPDSGGLDAAGRAKREAVLLQAAQLFEQDIEPVEVAPRLRVSANSAYRWRRAWRVGGRDGLRSTGPGGAECRLDQAQLARLLVALDAGPAAQGYGTDQRWTLARIADLIARLFHIGYSLRGVSYLLHRLGWSPQVPAQRAARRDEQQIDTWRRKTWASVRRWPQLKGRGSASPTRPAKPCSRRRHAPGPGADRRRCCAPPAAVPGASAWPDCCVCASGTAVALSTDPGRDFAPEWSDVIYAAMNREQQQPVPALNPRQAGDAMSGRRLASEVSDLDLSSCPRLHAVKGGRRATEKAVRHRQPANDYGPVVRREFLQGVNGAVDPPRRHGGWR